MFNPNDNENDELEENHFGDNHTTTNATIIAPTILEPTDLVSIQNTQEFHTQELQRYQHGLQEKTVELTKQKKFTTTVCQEMHVPYY